MLLVSHVLDDIWILIHQTIQRHTVPELQAMALPKTIAGRTRPIEKFANAVAKCSTEVTAESHY